MEKNETTLPDVEAAEAAAESEPETSLDETEQPATEYPAGDEPAIDHAEAQRLALLEAIVYVTDEPLSLAQIAAA
ncbi:MAG: hypothetical protein ACRD7E_28065, partial [Bryobacteraceae bacterium]